MDSMKAFIYFVEDDIVKDILPGWPSEMRLVLGLHKSGQCELNVFHRKEANQIIKRMSAILKLPLGSFGIVPKRPNYPTKTIRYSDQQRLLGLIAAKDGLCETASDYAINYRFAEEEGLDPVHFTRLPYRGKKPVKKSKPQDSALVVPFISRRFQTGQHKDVQKPHTYHKGTFAEVGQIKRHGKCIHLILNPDVATDDLPILKATKVLCKDEQGLFILERSLLGKWKTGDAAIIDLPAQKLADRLPPDYFKHQYIETVMIVPHGILVTYKLKIKHTDRNTRRSVTYPFQKNAIRGLTFADNQKNYR